MLMRASARASGAPGQVWMPWPNAMCWRALARSSRNSARVLELARVAVGGAVEHHQRRAGRDLDAADVVGTRVQAEVALDRALEPQALLDEVRDELAVGRAAAAAARGARRAICSAVVEQPDGGLLAGGEQVRGDPHDVDDLGQRAVGERRGGEAGHHVVARLARRSSMYAGELLVEELQRLVRHRRRRRCCRRLPCGAQHAARGTGSWSSSGTPSRSAITSSVNGLA